MSKPICTVMVGLPATGKSTRVESQREIYDAIDMDVFVYSTDRYIEDAARHFGKTYNEMFEDNFKGATASMEQLLSEAIEKGSDGIWDQTNLGVKKRKNIVNRMKQAGYQVRCECILPPEPSHISDMKDWKHRLENRPGKNIPNYVLTNMIESYVIPTIDEGFDTISFYNMHGALLGIDNGEEG